MGLPFPHVVRLVGVGIAAPCCSKHRVELAMPLCRSTRRCLIPALASSTGGRWASYASMLFDMAVLGSASCHSTCGCWASDLLWRLALCRWDLALGHILYLMALPSSHSPQVESPLLLSSMSMSISSWHRGRRFQRCRVVPNHSVGLVLSSLESLLLAAVPSPGCCGGVSQVASLLLSRHWDLLILMWFATLELDGELVSWKEGRKEGRKRTTTKVVVRCRDAPNGPPTTWVSLHVSPSSIPLSPAFPPSSEPAPPTSLWKGEGWTGPRFRMR